MCLIGVVDGAADDAILAHGNVKHNGLLGLCAGVDGSFPVPTMDEVVLAAVNFAGATHNRRSAMNPMQTATISARGCFIGELSLTQDYLF